MSLTTMKGEVSEQQRPQESLQEKEGQRPSEAEEQQPRNGWDFCPPEDSSSEEITRGGGFGGAGGGGCNIL